MKAIFMAMIVTVMLAKAVLAQSSSIPAFPDDDADLIDPALLDVTTSTPSSRPASATTTSTTTPTPTSTTTVPDSGTGTPTFQAALIAGVAAFAAMVIARGVRRRRNDDRFW